MERNGAPQRRPRKRERVAAAIDSEIRQGDPQLCKNSPFRFLCMQPKFQYATQTDTVHPLLRPIVLVRKEKTKIKRKILKKNRPRACTK